MEVTQIYSLVNSVNKQMWGEDAIAVHDLTGLISLGEQVFSSETDRDKFLGILADRVGKTIFRNLDLEVEFPEFIRNEFEWGAILSKINVQVVPAQSNESWNVGENDFVPNQFKIDKPVVYQSLFKGVVTWEYDLTVPDTLYRSAFLGESQFASFVSGLMGAQSDSLTLAINNMSHMALANLCAEKIKNENGVVNLLSLYNDTVTTPITAEDAMTTPDFYRYAGMVMRNYIKYLAQPSKLYNIGIGDDKMLRATARDNLHVIINSDFASGFDTFLTADTFNRDLAELPLYREFVSLQGTGTTAPNFTDNTTINIKPSSGGDAIVQSGIVGIYADRQAIGTFYNDRFTATDRNNRNRYTNYTSGCSIGWFNDLSESAVIFVIADTGE